MFRDGADHWAHSTMIDTERVLTEIGVRPISYATVKRRMPI
ncbi:hypothetical protein [Mycobacterium marinum]